MSQEECFAKGCTNMACEHMKGVTLAHDVTKQVTIEKTNVNGAVTATTTTVNGKVETQVLKVQMLLFRRKLML
jgi:K(+)-stimulated pyrophosphate-energized sodium pump